MKEPGKEAPGLTLLPPPDFDRGFPVSEAQTTSFLRHRAQGRRMGRVNPGEEVEAMWSSSDYSPSIAKVVPRLWTKKSETGFIPELEIPFKTQINRKIETNAHSRV